MTSEDQRHVSRGFQSVWRCFGMFHISIGMALVTSSYAPDRSWMFGVLFIIGGAAHYYIARDLPNA